VVAVVFEVGVGVEVAVEDEVEVDPHPNSARHNTIAIRFMWMSIRSCFEHGNRRTLNDVPVLEVGRRCAA
jgi:hypothetical protein